MFYKVKHNHKDRFGLDSLGIPSYLTTGRRIRWESANGIHGLIESQIVRSDGNWEYKVVEADTGKIYGSIPIERVAEIWMTEEEFENFAGNKYQ